jgi:hypothetical protein
MEALVHNMWTSRLDFLRLLGDRHLDIDAACNYPDAISAQVYRTLYDRLGPAERSVQLLPKETWQVTPVVYETESSRKYTPFEQAFDKLGMALVAGGGKSWYADQVGSPVWEYLLRGDIQSGIGVFGILLLGINDGKLLEQPVDGVPADGRPKDITGVSDLQTKDIYGGPLPEQQGLLANPPWLQQPLASTMGTDAQYMGVQFSPMVLPKKRGKNPEMTFMRVFDESLVQVVQYEASMYSPRFGMPVMYRVTLNDPRQPHTGIGLPLATVRVHWSRIVHLADNLGTSEVFGVPRMRAILNHLLDLRKLYGGSAEMFWRGAFPGLSIETHPSLGGEVHIDVPQLQEMMRKYHEGLDRWFALSGMSAKSLSPQIGDPSSQIAAQIEAVCIKLGVPVRVFKGSERGELASSQDDASWNDRLRHRQQTYVTPRIIVPFVNRLIQIGVLPEPESYSVDWPDLDSLGDTERASISAQKSTAVTTFFGGAGAQSMSPTDFWTRIMGFDDEEAKTIVEAAAKMPKPPAPPPAEGHKPPPPAANVAASMSVAQAKAFLEGLLDD